MVKNVRMEEEKGKGDGCASDEVVEQNIVQGKQRNEDEEVEEKVERNWVVQDKVGR